MSTDEILRMCFLFTLAGLDTVTAAIGFTLYHLARDPGFRQRLLDDPSLIGPTIEEILRLESVAPNRCLGSHLAPRTSLGAS